MKICAVSPFQSTSKQTLLNFIATNSCEFVLLPGYSSNTPDPVQVHQIVQSGTAVFVEGAGQKTNATPYFVTSKSITPMPKQLFVQQPTAYDVDSLIKILPQRTFVVGSRKITILICGELMAFNPDGGVKHGRKITFDVLANPAHTLMGHWNHLGKKLGVLSKGTLSVYTTNNNRNHNAITTNVRIYKNGTLLSNKYNRCDLAWCESEI